MLEVAGWDEFSFIGETCEEMLEWQNFGNSESTAEDTAILLHNIDFFYAYELSSLRFTPCA